MHRDNAAWKKLAADAPSDRLVGLADGENASTVAPVYGLVMLAGAFGGGSAVADFERMIQANLMSAVRAIDAVLPHLSSPGRIVAISSSAALARPSGLGAYTASKAALNAFVETLAKDLKSREVTVNALLPTALDSAESAKNSAERLVKRENVAEMISLLLSAQASNVSGQLIAMTA